jgi:hypothetical protein
VTNDDQFDEITQKFISSMGGVSCPSEEYRAALRSAIDEIHTAIEASESMPG